MTAHYLNPASIYGSSDTHPTKAVLDPANVEQHADMLRQMTPESMQRKLDAIGVDWFLDMVSGGHLLEELALAVRVRISVLRAWLRAKVPEQDYMDAQAAAAAYYRVKALRVVEEGAPTDRTGLGYMKLRSDVYRDMAEAMDPAEWNAPPSAAAQMGVANVVINMPSQAALGGVQQFGPGIAAIPLAQDVMPQIEQAQAQAKAPTQTQVPAPAPPKAQPSEFDPTLAAILSQIGISMKVAE